MLIVESELRPEIDISGEFARSLALNQEASMYNTIMIPTDCSGFDREAIRVALRIARSGKTKLHLVRVFCPGAFFGMAASPDGFVSADAIQQECDAALTELHALARECRSEGNAELIVSLQRGAVAPALEDYAQEHGVDLIVISSHGRGGISRLSLGSVTDSLIRHTTIPVLVVKPPSSYLDPKTGEPFRRMVVPLDGSPLAEQILPQVTALASLDDAEIKLLYVVKPKGAAENESGDTESWREQEAVAAHGYLSGVAGNLSCAGARVTAEVVVGENIAEEITVYAGREKVDLIAIATHGRGGLSRVVRGSVADAVTRSARTCVLVFHPLRPVSAVRGNHGTSHNRVVTGIPR